MGFGGQDVSFRVINIGGHFEAMCERNTGRWTAEQGKIAEGSCDGLQKPANLEIFVLLEWKPELFV